MRRWFALNTFAVAGMMLAGVAYAQTRPGTAPTRPLANPFGSTAAIAGQSRPLGGIPATGYGYASGYGRGNRGPRGGYGYGGSVYGFSTYVPGYWDMVGDSTASGPYSAYMPYDLPPAMPPPGPSAVPVPVPAGPAAPTVIINQYYGYPPPGAGPNGPEPEGAAARPGDPLAEPENYYLIAYKDHSIHAALAYWVEGSTLHYVTLDNAHNQVSLDLVDVAASTKLNSDHNVPFSITAR